MIDYGCSLFTDYTRKQTLKMKSKPKISETEWEIMRIVWRKHPVPAREILAQLKAAGTLGQTLVWFIFLA
jgi:hypothetical protein